MLPLKCPTTVDLPFLWAGQLAMTVAVQSASETSYAMCPHGFERSSMTWVYHTVLNLCLKIIVFQYKSSFVFWLYQYSLYRL